MTEFTRKVVVDKPGIVGAQWWQESVASQIPRRQAMSTLLVVGGAVAAMGAIGACVAVASSGSSSGGSSDDVKFEPRTSLDMQKEYGWNFGATTDSLVFDGKSTRPFERSALTRLPADLAPAQAAWLPYFVGTLFQSPNALPKTVLAGESSTPLKDALQPISTPSMDVAFKQGQALASLFDAKEPRAKDVAIIVDLPGPEAVAFAAGASSILEPVFLFDNWPHPRGVVPAHLTLAAAAYYQPMFAAARSARPSGARPLFVLDRKRLATYTDDASQFDNRHVAKLPSAANLLGLGVRNVLYVAPNAVDNKETDDIVDDFLAMAQRNVFLHTVPATAFDDDPSTPDPKLDAGTAFNGPYFYLWSKAKHTTFWTQWSTPSTGLSTNEVHSYTPTPRKTDFSLGTPAVPNANRPRPTNFGTVPVAIAIGTGVLLGAKLNRNGSWNRSPSYSSSSGGSSS